MRREQNTGETLEIRGE